MTYLCPSPYGPFFLNVSFFPILFVFLFHWFILEQVFTDGRFYSNYLCSITMKDIRLSDNPITDSGRGGVPRFVLIARLAKIQILNGSEVWQKYLCCWFAYFVYSLTKCNIFVSVLPFRLLLAKGKQREWGKKETLRKKGPCGDEERFIWNMWEKKILKLFNTWKKYFRTTFNLPRFIF